MLLGLLTIRYPCSTCVLFPPIYMFATAPFLLRYPRICSVLPHPSQVALDTALSCSIYVRCYVIISVLLVLLCAAMCCHGLLCVALCCSVLLDAPRCCLVLLGAARRCSELLGTVQSCSVFGAPRCCWVRLDAAHCSQ